MSCALNLAVSHLASRCEYIGPKRCLRKIMDIYLVMSEVIELNSQYTLEEVLRDAR